mmetsp:Transcript_43611/g.95034  ORF Transcript_43611/g.95034 Transcript_43611/m.95034 type:complete len:242 (-) Transcript_43611:123-848(-)
MMAQATWTAQPVMMVPVMHMPMQPYCPEQAWGEWRPVQQEVVPFEEGEARYSEVHGDLIGSHVVVQGRDAVVREVRGGLCALEFASGREAWVSDWLLEQWMRPSAPKRSSRSRARDVNAKGGQASRTLLVASLPESTGEAEMEEIFGEFGAVRKASLMRNSQGGSRCFGFVKFEDHAAAEAAKEAGDRNEVMFRTVAVRVEWARREMSGRAARGHRDGRKASQAMEDHGRTSSPESERING